MFLLDSTGRIGSSGFSKVKDFAKSFMSKFQIGDNNVRVGVIIFGYQVNNEDSIHGKSVLL